MLSVALTGNIASGKSTVGGLRAKGVARVQRAHARNADCFAIAARQPGLYRFLSRRDPFQYLGIGALYATALAFDSLFTPPVFLRKMAFSHAAPSPENRCFVRLGLARALLDSPPPGPCSHQYDRSKSGERVFSSISSV